MERILSVPLDLAVRDARRVCDIRPGAYVDAATLRELLDALETVA